MDDDAVALCDCHRLVFEPLVYFLDDVAPADVPVHVCCCHGLMDGGRKGGSLQVFSWSTPAPFILSMYFPRINKSMQ